VPVGVAGSGPLSVWTKKVRPSESRCAIVGVSACLSASSAARCSSAVPAWCWVSHVVPAMASLGAKVFYCQASNSTRDSLPSGSSVRITRSSGS
jgi:hypothetical protein